MNEVQNINIWPRLWVSIITERWEFALRQIEFCQFPATWIIFISFFLPHSVYVCVFRNFVVNLYVLGYSIFRNWSFTESTYHVQRSRRAEFALIPFAMVGSIIGCIFFGFITTKFGRKKPILYMSILLSIGCLLNLCARNDYSFQASMLMAGIFNGCMLIAAPLYLSEISNDR